jgi:hypothetical protein
VIERTAAATLDGRGGIGPLMLERATRIAREKARDVGVGVVRVTGIARPGRVLPVAMEAAIGPMVAALLGPDGQWSLAIPSAGGVPLVYDSTLDRSAGSAPGVISQLPWPLLLHDQEWIVQAIAVTAFEPLAGLHERVLARLEAGESSDGTAMLSSRQLEARFRDARLNGVPLSPVVVSQLAEGGQHLGIGMPEPRQAEVPSTPEDSRRGA